MIFADIPLAQQIEGAEALMMKRTVGSIPGAFVQDFAGGVATYVRPGSPMNKVIGAGLSAALDVAELQALERRFGAEGVRFEHSTLAMPENGALLTARGYQLLGFENVLARRLETAPSPKLRVDLVRDLSEWRRVLVEGFCVPDDTGVVIDHHTREVIETVMADMSASAEPLRYLALIDGVPCGAASMFVNGSVALFTGATTLASYRRRGVQAALLAARLGEAKARGAELAVITTAVGTQSQANAMKNGFSLLYPRAVLVRSDLAANGAGATSV